MAGYNLSCIVTLPIYQRQGYGFFLISFSYLLSQRENRLGSPEKPLSDLGLLSYRSYWKTTIGNALLQVLDLGGNISLQELGRRTGMTDDDVVSGLEGLDALVRDPNTGIYAIKVNREKLHERVDLADKKGYVKVKEDLLKWTPYLLGRREARELLDGGLDELIRHVEETQNDEEDIPGSDIPPQRFLSVAVRDVIEPFSAQLTYETEPQTPQTATPAATPRTKPPSVSPVEEPLMDDEEDTSPEPSITEEVSDEPFSVEDLEEEDDEEISSASEEEYLSSESNEFNQRKRRKTSSRTSSKMTPEVVVRVKTLGQSPSTRSFETKEIGKRKVIAAKAPRSRAGLNPPEVMSRRAGLRRV
jgi:histone acetyltransferase SAS3